MGLEILICFNRVDDLNKGCEEGLVIAIIEGLKVLSQEGNVSDDCEDIRGMDYFLPDGLSVLCDHCSDNSVEDKVTVAQ